MVSTYPPTPINPRLFGFNTILGPVLAVPYDDTGLMEAAQALNVGCFRYPGGTVANYWNMSSGRFADDIIGEPGEWAGGEAARNRAFPVGTFTPSNFMRGIGGLAKGSPIWDLNVGVHDSDRNIADPASQLNLLHELGVPVENVELGNEDVMGLQGLDAYIEAVRPIVNRTRALFPDAHIAMIGCWGLNWDQCAPRLRQEFEEHTLFDAVTMHDYYPSASMVNRAGTDIERRSVTLAAIRPWLAYRESQVSADISPSVPIWFTEVNWAGFWDSGGVWLSESHGGIRGLTWAAWESGCVSNYSSQSERAFLTTSHRWHVLQQVLAAMEVTAAAQAEGRVGIHGAGILESLPHSPPA